MVVAKTTKGKGVSYMENVPIWHYRSPNKDEYEQAIAGAGGAVVRNTFAEALYEEATQEPRHLHRRRRHFAGRQHGQVQRRNIRTASSTSASPSRA